DKNRHRLEQVQPENPATGGRIGLEIPHPEHINARFVGTHVVEAAGLAQRLEQGEVVLGYLDVARAQNRAQHREDPRIGPDHDLVALLYGNVIAGQQIGELRRQYDLTIATHHDLELVRRAGGGSERTACLIYGIDDAAHVLEHRYAAGVLHVARHHDCMGTRRVELDDDL